MPFTLLWLPVELGRRRGARGDRLRESVHAILTQSYELLRTTARAEGRR